MNADTKHSNRNIITYIASTLGVIASVMGFIVIFFPNAFNLELWLEHSKIVIEGAKFDDKKASAIMLQRLNSISTEDTIKMWKRLTGTEQTIKSNNIQFIHKIIAHYYLPYKKNGENKESVVVAAYSVPKNHECHACEVALSFMEFAPPDDKHGDGWIISIEDLFVLRDGAWGKPSDGLRVEQIGSQRFGVRLKSSYTSTGEFTEKTSIYAKLGGTYQSVFDEVTENDNAGLVGEDDPGYFNQKRTIEFLNQVSDSNFFDIKLSIEIFEQQRLSRSEKILTFVGRKYSER